MKDDKKDDSESDEESDERWLGNDGPWVSGT